MKRYLSLFFCCLLAFSPLSAESLSESILEQADRIETVATSLEQKEKELEELEQQYKISEQNLQDVQENLETVQRDYELSQKKLIFWKTSTILAILTAIIMGFIK